MFAVAAEWQAGDWIVSRKAPWTEPFVEQIVTFPAGRHDDMADAMSQAAAWLLETSIPPVTITNAFTGLPID
jgi:predicted phage terminase large subunit-like protein